MVAASLLRSSASMPAGREILNCPKGIRAFPYDSQQVITLESLGLPLEVIHSLRVHPIGAKIKSRRRWDVLVFWAHRRPLLGWNYAIGELSPLLEPDENLWIWRQSSPAVAAFAGEPQSPNYALVKMVLIHRQIVHACPFFARADCHFIRSRLRAGDS